jgi:2-polyprenyl-6-methoxyphenol hydroxylase-like FAD-dependent oxidoreductase
MLMSSAPLRVLIVGGGLAGPCLAQGLRRAGVEVSLYERDPAPASRGQGYRIHIAPEGATALRACLPHALFELAVATSCKPGGGVTVLDPELRVVHRMTIDAPEGHDHGYAGIVVDRLTLRQVLLGGLEDAVRFGAVCTGYELLAGGGVRARFADGSAAEGDLLVAADGGASRVRAQLLPQARVVDTGLRGVFGKTFLTEETRALVPPASLDGFSSVVGSDGRWMALAGMQFRTDPRTAAAGWPNLAFADPRDYVMWVLGAPIEALGEVAPRLQEAEGAELRGLVARLVADWHPDLGELVRRGDPATVSSTVIRTAEPVSPWPSGPVTLAGDAAHCMVPAGIGAAVALRDAGVLTTRLGEAISGEKPLLQAVAEYEREMLDYGFAAVAASLEVQKRHTP